MPLRIARLRNFRTHLAAVLLGLPPNGRKLVGLKEAEGVGLQQVFEGVEVEEFSPILHSFATIFAVPPRQRQETQPSGRKCAF